MRSKNNLDSSWKWKSVLTRCSSSTIWRKSRRKTSARCLLPAGEGHASDISPSHEIRCVEAGSFFRLHIIETYRHELLDSVFIHHLVEGGFLPSFQTRSARVASPPAARM